MHEGLPVQYWSVAILRTIDNDDLGEMEADRIGGACAVAIDIHEAQRWPGGAAGVLDDMSADLASFEVLVDPEVLDWADDLDLQGFESAALIVDRIQLNPDYRGQGLGPYVLAAIIRHLGRGCAMAAIYPAPIGEPENGKTRETATEALAATWKSVGFQPYREGIWVLDLATVTFDRCWQELRRGA